MTRWRWLPWVIAGIILGVAVLYASSQPTWVRELSPAWQVVLWGGALFGLFAVYLATGSSFRFFSERRQMHRRVEVAERRVAEAYQRLEAIFQISQKFVEASDENEVVELVLRLSVDLVGAKGASFVPLDEHGQPLTAVSHGELPFPVMEAWMEYLASPAIRDSCRSCENHAALTTTCPLLKGPFADAIGMFCLPLRRGEREFGVLNLFMPNIERLDGKTRAFLKAMMDETALALEGVRLRRREQEALRRMQALRQKTDLTALLTSLLENVHHTLESDFAVLVIQTPAASSEQVVLGNFPSQKHPLIEGVLQGVIASGEPVLLGDVAGDPATSPGVSSLLAAPLLLADRTALGALLVGKRRLGSFNQRQLALLQTVAGQVALLVQNANLMAELEYKAMIEERARLAREIHDGLAQTLGFLKLQAAQMKNYLARNEMERLRQSANLCYSTISEAYQDVRQAIDGLRIWPAESGLSGWLGQTVSEFQETSGLPTKLDEMTTNISLPPEVHAQLIRIVQEALSNVRKHAQAAQVWVSCHESGGDLVLEIRDDGHGFSPGDVPGPSQHGLRGMRERADLIGADFQVIGCPQGGTTIRVRLPLLGLQGFSGSRLGERAS